MRGPCSDDAFVLQDFIETLPASALSMISKACESDLRMHTQADSRQVQED